MVTRVDGTAYSIIDENINYNETFNSYNNVYTNEYIARKHYLQYTQSLIQALISCTDKVTIVGGRDLFAYQLGIDNRGYMHVDLQGVPQGNFLVDDDNRTKVIAFKEKNSFFSYKTELLHRNRMLTNTADPSNNYGTLTSTVLDKIVFNNIRDMYSYLVTNNCIKQKQTHSCCGCGCCNH